MKKLCLGVEAQTLDMAQQDDFVIFEEMGRNPVQRMNDSQSATEKQPIPGDYNSLYEELLDKCDPARFMIPYNQELVDIANEIYNAVLHNKDNEKELRELRLRAADELHAKFSTANLYGKLKSLCNPKNYTGKQYDKANLSIANQLYARILQNADDIETLEQIEKDANKLKFAVQGSPMPQRNGKVKKEKDDFFYVYVCLVSLLAVLVSIILFVIVYNNVAS